MAGIASVTISATNAVGTGSANLMLYIVSAAPVINSPSTATGKVGVPFSYQITASGYPTRYYESGFGPNFTFHQDTGLITGTAMAAGTLNVTLSASNVIGTGGTAPLTATFTNQ